MILWGTHHDTWTFTCQCLLVMFEWHSGWMKPKCIESSLLKNNPVVDCSSFIVFIGTMQINDIKRKNLLLKFSPTVSITAGVISTVDAVITQIAKSNIGPTWVLSAPDGPHVGPMNLTIRAVISRPKVLCFLPLAWFVFPKNYWKVRLSPLFLHNHSI